MRCSKCGAENSDRAKFCEECGTPFKRRCPSCGAENTPTAKFCIECGKALDGAGKSQPTPPSGNSPIKVNLETEGASLEGERKTVTALFADIKGSMELIEDLDPEEARAIVDPALTLMMEGVHHYGGYVAQSTGDGIFALFGAPIAYEDHPRRALFAALRMQEGVKRHAEKLRAEKGVNLQVRVGVNIGEVVVRTIKTGETHTEYVPIGHSISLASRLQALASPGSIAISDAVRKLVEGYLVLKALGSAKIKGVSEPVNVYEVTGLGPLRTPLQRAAGRGLTKFVGRGPEMEAIERAAELAKAGRGQVVAAVAEPGVGKSRLYHEFKLRNQSGWMVLEAYSVSHGKASAYLPVIDLLFSYFGIAADDDERKRREKVAGKILILDRATEDALPYVYALLGIADQPDPLAQMDAQVRKRRTLDAIRRILLHESRNQPLMMIFEDLHWIDEETQALLNLLTESIGDARILLLVNYRPEYQHEWGTRTSYTQLRLEPLGRESAAEMLSALLFQSALPAGEGEGALVTDPLAPLKRLIIERTEGTPFFMEEIVQTLFEQGALERNGAVKLAKPINTLQVPMTVQAVLAARIDRLPREEKDLLQTLAMIGKEVPLNLLREIIRDQARPLLRGAETEKNGAELEAELADLQAREFIYEGLSADDIHYTFKHALTQEVAYNSVLTERRKAIHERVGAAIETLWPDSLDDHLNQLAHHYGRSANAEKAVEFLTRAAQKASSRSADKEAEAYLKGALSLIERLPEGSRAARELRLRLLTADTASALRGYAAPEVGDAAKRALELARSLGDREAEFNANGVLYFHYDNSGYSSPLQEIAESMARQAEESGEPRQRVRAHHMLGLYLHVRTSDLTHAREQYEKAIAAYNSISDRDLYMRSEFAIVKAMLGSVLGDMGSLDQAVKTTRDAVEFAREKTTAFILGWSLHWLAIVCRARGDIEGTLAVARALESLAEEYGLSDQLGRILIARGWATARKGQLTQNIEMTNLGLETLRAALNTVNTVNGVEAQLAIAEVALAAGDTKEGLAALQKIEPSRTQAWPGFRFAVQFFKGYFLSMSGAEVDAHEAEAIFRSCLDYARKWQWKSFELNTAVALARLMAQTGRRDEARAMLAEIYNWFTEGFDTADLKDAKALLEELCT